MAEIMHLLGEVGVGLAAVEREPAGGQMNEPGNHPQQGRLAGAIASGDQQRLAATQAETQSAEHRPAAADAGEILRAELHQRPCVTGRGRPWFGDWRKGM